MTASKFHRRFVSTICKQQSHKDWNMELKESRWQCSFESSQRNSPRPQMPLNAGRGLEGWQQKPWHTLYIAFAGRRGGPRGGGGGGGGTLIDDGEAPASGSASIVVGGGDARPRVAGTHWLVAPRPGRAAAPARAPRRCLGASLLPKEELEELRSLD